MCGIVGIVKRTGEQVATDDIGLMCSTLVHRGPDEAGYAHLHGGKVGFGHLRLSIVDLVGGQQPIYNEDYSVCLVFNGEIYDYQAIRKRLIELGHSFRTQTDSEVIIHLYEEYGLDFFKELNGEFAFLLWDQKKRRLLAARDRFGVKPLFYRVTPDEVLFASEAKAILALPRVERRLSNQYLTGPLFGVIPPDNCAFEGIAALKPAHMMLIEGSEVLQVRPYWTLNFDVSPTMSRREAEEGVLDRLQKAVTRRMVADVDVGVYLSGGLDSTLVCALMTGLKKDIRAFNIGFGGSVYDEAHLSSRIAKHYGARFSSIDCSMESMSARYLETINHVELALANPSAMAKLMLSEFVRAQGVKVCLTGEGADEGFGGYAFFKLEKLWQMLESEDPAVRRRGKRLLKRFKHIEHRSRGILWDSDLPWRRGPRPMGYANYQHIRARYSNRYAQRVFERAARNFTAADTPLAVFEKNFLSESVRTLDPFNASRTVAMGQLSGYVIPSLGDRVEMAHSVECRTPFLDRDLIEFIARVPPEYFIDIDQLREKDLLRRATNHLLPDFVKAEHKHPFFSNNWRAFYRTPRGRELFDALTSAQAFKKTGIFDSRWASFYLAIWKAAPESSRFFKRLDLFVGFMLGTQALDFEFVARRPLGRARLRMTDRTHREGATLDQSDRDRSPEPSAPSLVSERNDCPPAPWGTPLAVKNIPQPS
jgi:asparagine synthase (glutamine-hydrolysing)